MSHSIKCKHCQLIYNQLREKFWMINDELIEKASKRRCGFCRLYINKETRETLSQQRMIKENMRIITEQKICPHVTHCKYSDGSIDDGTASGIREVKKLRDEGKIDGLSQIKRNPKIKFMNKPVGDWFDGKIPGTIVETSDETKLN